MEIIDQQLLNKVCQEATRSERLRKNYNFHKDLDDPVNRLLNAMQPGTYIRPHRHLSAQRQEMFLVLQGKIAFFLFDDEGRITKCQIIGPSVGVYGMDIEPDIWHSLIVLEPNTVIYEIKAGPFAPLSPSDLAPWSPDAADTKACIQYMNTLKGNM